MTTIFTLFENTTELTESELSELFRCIDRYSNTKDGEWLKGIDYKQFTYMWKHDWKGGYIQAARPLFGKQIVLQPYGFIELSAAPVIHELRHVWQRKKYGILVYSLLSIISKIPGLYESAPLEKDAFEQQDKANMYIQRYVKE
jgi:hypothetical protein